jgi:hypothetical protein
MTDIIRNTIANFDYGFVFTPVDIRKQATVNRVLNNMVAMGKSVVYQKGVSINRK